MNDPVIVTLAAMTFLLIKHTFADYVLQTPYMFGNKGTYGHPGGLMHAGIHIAMTSTLFLLIPPFSATIGAVILGGEFLAHYHIDWAKEKLVCNKDLDPDCARYWNLHGLDQLLHGLTYVAITALLIHPLFFAT